MADLKTNGGEFKMHQNESIAKPQSAGLARFECIV